VTTADLDIMSNNGDMVLRFASRIVMSTIVKLILLSEDHKDQKAASTVTWLVMNQCVICVMMPLVGKWITT
jgi:hypothetical protein